MKPHDRDLEILEHVINYCDEIERTIVRFGNDYRVFKKDTIYRNACAMCLLQIGELCNSLSLNFRKKYTEMPWSQIRGMRNVVAHAYGSVSTQTTWDTIKNDVPKLKEFCVGILAAE